MRVLRIGFLVVLGMGLVQLCATRTVAQTTVGTDANIDAINKATSPSAAIDVYTEAIAENPRSVRLRQAYLQRMVEFGLVDSLHRQAESLLKLDPKNGLALAVAGFHKARTGDMQAAFSDELLAVNRLPANLFVQQVAGQLVAWYDSQPDPSALAPVIATNAETFRNVMGNKKAYLDAYQAANTTLQPQAPAQSAVTEQPPAQTYSYGRGTAGNAPSYESYYPYGDYAYYPYWYYTPYYYWPYNYPPTVLCFGVDEDRFCDGLEEFLEHHHGFLEHHPGFCDRLENFIGHHHGFLDRHPEFFDRNPSFLNRHPEFFQNHPQLFDRNAQMSRDHSQFLEPRPRHAERNPQFFEQRQGHALRTPSPSGQRSEQSAPRSERSSQFVERRSEQTGQPPEQALPRVARTEEPVRSGGGPSGTWESRGAAHSYGGGAFEERRGSDGEHFSGGHFGGGRFGGGNFAGGHSRGGHMGFSGRR